MQEKKRLEAAILEADTKAGALRASLDGQWGQLKELKNQACLFLLANIRKNQWRPPFSSCLEGFSGFFANVAAAHPAFKSSEPQHCADLFFVLNAAPQRNVTCTRACVSFSRLGCLPIVQSTAGLR
jgi:hypothetical protein